jgi:hypothetical protein
VSDHGTHAETSEGLHYAVSLIFYARNRFIVNLLPQLQQATALRRVVTVVAGGKEGPIDANDLQCWNVPFLSARGHGCSMITLSLETLAKKAPNVSFIHDYPGAVKTNIASDAKGVIMFFMRAIFKVLGPLVYIPNEECGERHLFLATSAKYPAGAAKGEDSGLPLADGIAVARGTDGKTGSGVYSVDWDGESAGPKVEELLANLREQGMPEKVWNHAEEEYKRITGVVAV